MGEDEAHGRSKVTKKLGGRNHSLWPGLVNYSLAPMLYPAMAHCVVPQGFVKWAEKGEIETDIIPDPPGVH